ncbi:WASH complex subunit 2-like [Planococcus citri]|uniref:WASH complex subunit 2-like n=1 Tax=Planococcus citri TaxID=170843 RepID=UPI0031F75052
MEKKNVWSTSDIVANRNNWSLAADVELLKHLQSLSEKILAKANASLQSLNSFENDVNQTCISIANTSNKFKSLSDTQFIESKVQEENSDVNEQPGSQNETPDNRENQNITVKLKEALENGFQVLDTQYDVIPVSGSDSEDDGPEEILLRARNPYLSRRLPHIIGSEEFTRNDNLGLIDSSSEEEDEEEEEDDDEDDDTDDNEEKAKKPLIDSDEDSISIQKSPSPKQEFLRPRTQIIRISSSDSEDSDVSIPCDRSNVVQEKVSSENKKKPVEMSKENDNDHNPSSFADHLNAALKNNPRNIYSIVPPDFADTFSPPPFPGVNNDVSSEGDGDSEDDGDIFSTKKNTKHSIRNTNYKSNYGDESDDDDDWNTEKTGVTSQKSGAPGEPSQSTRKSSIVSKTSQHSDTSSSSKDSHVTSDKSATQSLPKSKIVQPNTNPMNKRMAAAINAELSAKLNLKNPSNSKSSENLTSAKTSIKSTESRTPVETPPAKSSENTTPVKSTKPSKTGESIQSTTSKTESKHTAMFEKIDDENSSENDDEDDLFKGISVAKKTASQNTKKTKGLFGDDDNIDNLFSPVKSTRSVAKKSTDLFSSESTSSKPVKLDETVNKPAAKLPVVDLLKKTSDLFASDSESEDDIFSIIKGQKKVDTDIFKTKTDTLENSFSGSKPTTNSNKRTPTVDPISKSDPLEVNSSSLFIEQQLPFQKASIKSTNSSSEQSITKRNDVINVVPSSEDDLFENVKKTTADLFQSDSNDDGDDLFGKKLKSDRQTLVRENASVSKSSDLFVDTSEAEKSKTDIISSAESVSKNLGDVTKKSEPDQSTSSESLNETEKPSLSEKNTVQSDKVNDIIATIRSPKLSSSSSSSDSEDVKKQNTFVTKVSDASKKDKNEKSVARPSRTEDDLFDELSHTNDLFSEYGKFATGVKSSNNNDDVSSSAKEDIFGGTYETRSAIFSPPKDDLSDGFSEDDDIKESNYLSQEDDDLFGEKFEPPPFQRGIPDDNTNFDDESSADFQEQQKKSSTTDAVAVVDDLFAKSTSSLPVSGDVFHETDLFGGQKDNKLAGNTSSKKSSSENSNSSSDSKNRLIAGSKDDSIQKPLVSNEHKLHSPDNNVPSTSESKDDISNASKKSRSLFFTEKELFDSDSDESDVIANKTAVPISPPNKIIAPKETDQITPSSPSKDEKSNENLEDNSATKKTSPSSKMDKISPAVFEKYDDAARKQSKDEQDGNLFAKSASSEPVLPVRNTPGKLAMGRGLNINVNALLPGSNWSSKNKQKQTAEQVTSDEKRDSEPAAIPSKTQDVSEKPSALLNNVIKERAKVTGKRRPPSRQARISRILTEDVFGGSGFGTESLQEEEKSNVSFESPKNRDQVRVDESKKSEKGVTLKDDLFGGDDEGKIDDLFGISRSRKESTIEKPSVITNKAVSNVSNSLQGIDIDLNLDVNPSLNRLPNLTKDRAKPQKRPSQPKKTPSNVASAVVEEQVTSAESKSSKPDAEKLDARVEKSSSISNSSKQDVSSSVVIHSAKSIFDSLDDDDDGDDDLFENLKSKKIIEEKSAATKAEVKVETKKPSQSNQQPVVTKPKTNSKINIFNDDDEGDELFGSAKKKLSANKLSKKSSLFEDNDDDDLFGAKTSTSSGRKSTAPATTSLKTKPLNEKPRILKLRSETVQKDPLTGKDLSGPL